MSTKLETETFAAKTIQAYKDQAVKAGLKLRMPADISDTGDFPQRIYDSLRRFRRNIAITKNHKKIVTSIHRQLVNERDEKGRPVKKEYITYQGYYRGETFKGEIFDANFEIGKYYRPKIVHNGNIRYDSKTGEPIGNEKALSGQDTVYNIEVPKDKTTRKKLVDSIIGDNFPEAIKYYFDNENEELGRSDSTFDYNEFVNDTIEELRKKSFQGGGAKTSGIWRDKDNNLRDKFGQLVTPEGGNKGQYQ